MFTLETLSQKGKVDWVGMKAAFNAAFYAQVMLGQPGHPMSVGADMMRILLSIKPS